MLLAAAAPASAAGPEWRLDPLAPTTAAPGGTFRYLVQATNAGDASAEAAAEAWTFTVTLPEDLSPVGVTDILGQWDCSSFISGLTCESTSGSLEPKGFTSLLVEVAVDPGASGVLNSKFQIAGGEPNPSTPSIPPRSPQTCPASASTPSISRSMPTPPAPPPPRPPAARTRSPPRSTSTTCSIPIPANPRP